MATLTLTVLGSSPAWPNPGGACSGYLIRAGGTSILADCGPGVVGRLRAALDVRELRAAVISHMHPDHYLDLVALRNALKYGEVRDGRPLDVFLPPGGVEILERVGAALDGGPDAFTGVLTLAEYAPDRPLDFGGLTVGFRRVVHYIPCYAMRFEGAGRSLVFSGDAAPCDALVEHARGADALLAESAFERRDQDNPDPALRGHMVPAEAGEMAARAGVGRLLITHAPLDPADPERVAREAATTFAGPVERVRDGATYEI